MSSPYLSFMQSNFYRLFKFLRCVAPALSSPRLMFDPLDGLQWIERWLVRLGLPTKPSSGRTQSPSLSLGGAHTWNLGNSSTSVRNYVSGRKSRGKGCGHVD